MFLALGVWACAVRTEVREAMHAAIIPRIFILFPYSNLAERPFAILVEVIRG
jgi:hypothetical protein